MGWQDTSMGSLGSGGREGYEGGRPNLGLSELSARGFQEISPINWVTPGIPISGLAGK